MTNSSNTANRLAHTKRNCKYNKVFAPEYRRKVFYEEHRLEARGILRKLCDWKGAERKDILRTLSQRKGAERIEGEVMSRSHPFPLIYSAQNERLIFKGYLKGKEQFKDISKRWNPINSVSNIKMT